MVLVGKTESKRPMGTLKCRWKDNIKFGIQEMGWSEWTRFIWLRIEKKWWALVNKVMNFNVP